MSCILRYRFPMNQLLPGDARERRRVLRHIGGSRPCAGVGVRDARRRRRRGRRWGGGTRGHERRCPPHCSPGPAHPRRTSPQEHSYGAAPGCVRVMRLLSVMASQWPPRQGLCSPVRHHAKHQTQGGPVQRAVLCPCPSDSQLGSDRRLPQTARRIQ